MYEVTVIFPSALSCETKDTVRVCFERNSQANIIQNDTTICLNNTLTLDAEGGINYVWSTGELSSSITFIPSNTGLFFISVRTENGTLCEPTFDTIRVQVLPELNASISTTELPIIYCPEDSVILSGFDPTHLGRTVTYTWTKLNIETPDIILQQGLESSIIIPYREDFMPYPIQIELLVDDGICQDRQTITILYEPIDVVNLTQFNIACLGDLATIGTRSAISTSGEVTFVWQTGDTTPTIEVGSPGYYSVMITAGNCSYLDSIEVVFRGNGIANVIDTAVCFQPNLSIPDITSYTFLPVINRFYINYPGVQRNVIWLDSIGNVISNSQNISISSPGIYTSILTTSLGASCGSDTTILIVNNLCPTLLYVPDIFTPNGDGLNDNFSVFGYYLRNFKMTIYDRWQNVVYTKDIESEFNLSNLNDQDWWNGTRFNTGAELSVGTYEWVITYEDRTSENPIQSIRGYVLLER